MQPKVWMNGPYYVRAQIIASLRIDLEDIYPQLRNQWGLREADFPYIEEFDKNEPRKIQSNSLITVNMQQANGFDRTDNDNYANIEYRIRYRVRVYSFVKIGTSQNNQLSGRENVIRYRDMMCTAIRAALLQHLSFHTSDMELKQETMTESYSDPTDQASKGDRWYAGAYHEFDVLVDENSLHDPIGTVETVSSSIQVTTAGSMLP